MIDRVGADLDAGSVQAPDLILGHHQVRRAVRRRRARRCRPPAPRRSAWGRYLSTGRIAGDRLDARSRRREYVAAEASRSQVEFGGRTTHGLDDRVVEHPPAREKSGRHEHRGRHAALRFRIGKATSQLFGIAVVEGNADRARPAACRRRVACTASARGSTRKFCRSGPSGPRIRSHPARRAGMGSLRRAARGDRSAPAMRARPEPEHSVPAAAAGRTADGSVAGSRVDLGVPGSHCSSIASTQTKTPW